jgi:hypothetical protein
VRDLVGGGSLLGLEKVAADVSMTLWQGLWLCSYSYWCLAAAVHRMQDERSHAAMHLRLVLRYPNHAPVRNHAAISISARPLSPAARLLLALVLLKGD